MTVVWCMLCSCSNFVYVVESVSLEKPELLFCHRNTAAHKVGRNNSIILCVSMNFKTITQPFSYLKFHSAHLLVNKYLKLHYLHTIYCRLLCFLFLPQISFTKSQILASHKVLLGDVSRMLKLLILSIWLKQHFIRTWETSLFNIYLISLLFFFSTAFSPKEKLEVIQKTFSEITKVI